MRFQGIVILLFLYTVVFPQQWKELGPCGSDTYGNRVAPQGGTGQVHCITFDPDNASIVYCGSPFGGLWKSKDGGKSWSNSEIDKHQDLELSSVCDIAFTKRNGKKMMWLATGHPGDNESTGLYLSENDGSTFAPVRSFNDKYHFHFKDNKHISKIAAHPQNPDILFLATSDGIYRTTDGGKKWKLVLTEQELPSSYGGSKGIFSVQFSLKDPDHVVYASGKDIYRTVKGGAKGSFKTMTNDGENFFAGGFDCFKNANFNISVNRDSLNTHDVLYAYGFLAGDSCNGNTQYMTLFFYNGSTWEKKSSVPNTNSGDPIRIKLSSVPGSPSIIYLGTINTFLSNDYGTNWRMCTDYNQPGHADVHALEVIPGTKDMITGTDGGIFRYYYESGKVEEDNNGLCISMVIDMGTSATNPKKIIIGNQDTGSDIWDGSDWTKLPLTGDGYPGQLIDVVNENHFFTCSNFNYWVNDGKKISLKPYFTCTNSAKAWPRVFIQNPVHPNTFYYADKELYKSEDTAKTWCRISDFATKQVLYINPNGHFIWAVAPAPSDTNVIYIAFNAFQGCCNSYLLKTEKGGMQCRGNCGAPVGNDNWKLLTNAPHIETGDAHENFMANSTFRIVDIAVSNTDPNKLWTCYATVPGNKIAFKVYKSLDGGESWLADEDGLPDYPFNKIVYVSGSNDALFLATQNGVYFKQGNEAWKRFGENMPKVNVVDLEINYKVGKLRAATYGRGVWEIDLPR